MMQRRRFLGVASCLTAGSGIADSFGAPKLQAREPSVSSVDPHTSNGRTLTISLNGEWSIITDPRNEGREKKWARNVPAGSKSTRVPSIIQETFPAYHGVVWYFRDFEPEVNPYSGGRFLLRFNAIDYLAEIWLNGEHVGRHEGADTPFVLDATDQIHPAKPNHLAVRVLNPGDERIDGMVLVETPHLDKAVDYVNGNVYDYGGIVGDVELLLTPAVHVTDLVVRPNWKTGGVKVQATLHNASTKTDNARVHFHVSGASMQQALLHDVIEAEMKAGDTEIRHEFNIKAHQLWDLDTPYLYTLSLAIEPATLDGSHEVSTTFGFRDFRVVNGYFRLNDRRVFLRCTHTGNHTPFSINLPPEGYPDMLRRDLVYAKASGFNTVRFISGIAHPYQLDLCDELGLMVYQEPRGAWLLKDSPYMKERYEISLREMILRDRNHPSVVIWGMLNETTDGPVFREAVSALALVRSLDDSRVALLSSGRFDGHLEIGSISNPGSSVWEPTWGSEAPGAGLVAMKYPSGLGTGDFHMYPFVPQSPEANHLIRTMGKDSKPIFLSEYGIGSMMDVIHEAKMYEQSGIREDAEDYVLMRSMADRLIADWSRFGMEVVYPFPETLLRVSQESMARHRLLGFNLIRSNPNVCGFNLTGMLDHGMTGEGVWRFWRDWKPGAFDAMQDGWAPLRWCLFVEPTHTYVGRPVTLEAVLANEDVLRPGDYPVEFRAWGPKGVAWQRKASIHVPTAAEGKDGPLALSVLKEEVVLTAPGGVYQFVPYTEKSVAPPETSWEFHLTDPSSLPFVNVSVTSWGLPPDALSWIKAHGVTASPFAAAAPRQRELILVGDVSADSQAGDWKRLAERIATGSTAVFLAPKAFKRGKDGAAWLPLTNKGRVYEFVDLLYHKECVAKPHRVFEGLQGQGILDMYYYGPMWPHYLFDGQDTPSEVMAAAFATGYSTKGGYASGVLMGTYKVGAGQFIVNAFPVLENLSQHPVADRMLLNLIQYCAGVIHLPPAELPSDFNTQLKRFGYL